MIISKAIGLLSALVALVSAGRLVHPLSRHIEVINESGGRLLVDWVNPETGELVKFADPYLGNGGHLELDSFVNHTFMFRKANNESCSEEDPDRGCHVGFVTIGESDDQVVIVKNSLDVEKKDHITDAQDTAAGIVANCRSWGTEALQQAKTDEQKDQVMSDVMTCLEQHTAQVLMRKNEELAFEEKTRLAISAMAENYTCADNTRPTTSAQEIRTWTHRNGTTTHEVHVLHERPSSQIHVLKNFISPDECDAIEKAAAKTLHRGTVADGSGGSRLSDSRKAWQAGVKIPWDKAAKTGEDNPIVRVVRRLYDYANHATGYGMDVVGQEDIMSIQYFGAGDNSTEPPDQYRPHCDGDCAGLPHKSGGRVATMVMYCDAPVRGGGTNFQNSGVYVKPEVGAAAFFSYMDTEKKVMDTGFTSHSGCPVIEGTKRIAVQWMRIGVDKENPWDSFNTLTIKRSEEDC